MKPRSLKKVPRQQKNVSELSDRPAIALPLPDAGQINAAQDERQLHPRQADAGALGVEDWQLKSAGLKALVPNRQAVVVPIQQLQAVAAAIDEHVQAAGEHVAREMFLRHSQQAVEATTHV